VPCWDWGVAFGMNTLLRWKQIRTNRGPLLKIADLGNEAMKPSIAEFYYSIGVNLFESRDNIDTPNFRNLPIVLFPTSYLPYQEQGSANRRPTFPIDMRFRVIDPLKCAGYTASFVALPLPRSLLQYKVREMEVILLFVLQEIARQALSLGPILAFCRWLLPVLNEYSPAPWHAQSALACG
jgi:hypothetical protein